jgi:hypothetical protein
LTTTESDGLPEQIPVLVRKQGTPMRITLAIAVAATFALAAWWNYPTFADARQAAPVSIDPTHMMTTVTELPPQQYVAY